MEEEESTIVVDDYDPKTQWGIPQCLDNVAFVGKDVIAVAHDIYVFFTNIKTGTEMVFAANSKDKGDGIDCFDDEETQSYLSVSLIEGNETLISFSSFPNFVICVWNWRTAHKLVSVPTEVPLEDQIILISKTHPMICQCWRSSLAVWEIGECYKNCLLMKRIRGSKEAEVRCMCWTIEGQLFVVDENGCLNNMTSDGGVMIRELEWTPTTTGDRTPLVCALSNGLLFYGDDGVLRYLKRVEKKWTEVWTLTEKLNVIQMISNQSCDVAIVWTESGCVFRVSQSETSKESIEIALVSYKQRNIREIAILAPNGRILVTINDASELCLYDIATGSLINIYKVNASDLTIRAVTKEEIIIVGGEVGENYGIALFKYNDGDLDQLSNRSLTNQIISRIVISKNSKYIAAVSMDAGSIFLMKVVKNWDLRIQRYIEVGRGLADILFCQAGGVARLFPLVLFSDRYRYGERLMCIEAETGRDNKVSGKMQGPYQKLVAMEEDDYMIMIPHMSSQYHILKLTAGKSITVNVRIVKTIKSGHEMRSLKATLNTPYLVTYGMAGRAIVRKANQSEEYEVLLPLTHRLEIGVKFATADPSVTLIASLANNRTVSITYLKKMNADKIKPLPQVIEFADMVPDSFPTLDLFDDDINYLDIIEERLVEEERVEFAAQREKIVAKFTQIQEELVELLEENFAAPPLHQLPIAEFDLNMEVRQARTKQAAEDREKLKRSIEAQIAAQDKVTQWMREKYWDIMKVQRTKLRAIFSHYEVENYATLPSERDNWIELQRIKYWRENEMENDDDVFKPWIAKSESVLQLEAAPPAKVSSNLENQDQSKSAIPTKSQTALSNGEEDEQAQAEKNKLSFAFSGTLSHLFIKVPYYDINQMLVYSFLQTRYMQEIVKAKTFMLRDWFNKEFDSLMATKKREVGLVMERNNRLRVIISELNKLAALRGSANIIMTAVRDPEWEQDEEPEKIMAVDPKEVSITPYISPSQIIPTPPTPKPKDDFKERALMDMMDGVLEKLWHEEIKKPIPKPQCMIDKEPEHWHEDELRQVFEYERKVEFRNEEREKYRHMLHAEWTKLSEILDEGVVRFNAKVNDLFITKLNVESSIGQENLNLMRYRRINLDRLEKFEDIDSTRFKIEILEKNLEFYQVQLKAINQSVAECQQAYDSLTQKDRTLDRVFKGNFSDQTPVVQDQCYKLFKKRPKWLAKATSASVLWTMAAAATRSQYQPPLLPPECSEFLKGIDALDSIVNMPAIIDEPTWSTMCRLRRIKIDSETRLRALVSELAATESTGKVWSTRIANVKHAILVAKQKVQQLFSRNRDIQIQLVLPAGSVEVPTSGHEEDFDDAAVILKEDVEEINKLILRVGAIKLAMIRKQIAFRAAIIAKEWEHELMKIKLKHMKEELYNYERIKLPKELQEYLKDKYQGYPEDEELALLEKETETAKQAHKRRVGQLMAEADALEDRRSMVKAKIQSIENIIYKARLIISENRLKNDPLESARKARARKKRMNVIVERNKLVREVQDNHTAIILMQTHLELLRLKTYPTLANFDEDLKELKEC